MEDESYCPGCGVMGEGSECAPNCERAAEMDIKVPYTYTLPQQFVEDKEVPARWRIWAVINGFFISGQYCWASNEWLSKQVKIHKDSVSQAVKELEDLQIIKCVRGSRSRKIYPMIGANAYQWSAITPIKSPYDRHERLSISYSGPKSEKDISKTDVLQVYDVIQEGKEKQEKLPSKYPHSKEVFSLWGSYPKNWALNKTQLIAAENLFEEHGLDEIQNALKWYKKCKDMDFCPQITSPYDLDSKWIKLEDFVEKI